MLQDQETSITLKQRSRTNGAAHVAAMLTCCFLMAFCCSSEATEKDINHPNSGDCRAPGGACTSSLVGHKQLPDGEATDTTAQRKVLHCAWKIASAAYASSEQDVQDKLTPECAGNLDLKVNRDVVKVWSRSTARTELVVIGNRGSASLGDWIRDLQNAQLARDHHNALNPDVLPRLGSLGEGWSIRWTNQAQWVKSEIDQARARARWAGKDLEVQVVGHSLGAAVSTIAGYDIAQYLRNSNMLGATAQNVPYDVFVYSFNPPNMLGRGWLHRGAPGRPRYVEALTRSVRRALGPDVSLTIRQMTRNLDPVQSLPPVEVHPVWSPRLGDTTVDMWNSDGRRHPQDLGYCPQLNVRSRSWINIVENHTAQWDDDIRSTSDEQIRCMFRRRTDSAVYALEDANRYAQYGISQRTAGQPALAPFRGTPHIAYQHHIEEPIGNPSSGESSRKHHYEPGSRGGHRILVSHRLNFDAGNDGRWSMPVVIPGSLAVGSPTMSHVDHSLYVAYRGLDDVIRISRSSDGRAWTAPLSTGLSTTSAPSLHGYYMAYQAPDKRLMVAFGAHEHPANILGERWIPAEITVGGRPVLTGGTPSMLIISGKSYIAFRANDSTGALWLAYRDGRAFPSSPWILHRVPDAVADGDPAISFDSGRRSLVIAYRRGGGWGQLSFTALALDFVFAPRFDLPWRTWSAPLPAIAGSSPGLLGAPLPQGVLAAFPDPRTQLIRLIHTDQDQQAPPHIFDLRAVPALCPTAEHIHGFATRHYDHDSDRCQCGELLQGQMLTRGQSVWGCSGSSVLHMSLSGSLEVWNRSSFPHFQRVWVGPVSGSAAMIDDSGRLIILGRQGEEVWSNGGPARNSPVKLGFSNHLWIEEIPTGVRIVIPGGP